MSDLFFSIDLLGEFDRLQRQMARVFAGFSASRRAMRNLSLPSTGAAPTSAPGSSRPRRSFARQRSTSRLTRGLTIGGERKLPEPEADNQTRQYAIPAMQRELSRRRGVASALPRVRAPRRLAAQPLYGLQYVSFLRTVPLLYGPGLTGDGNARSTRICEPDAGSSGAGSARIESRRVRRAARAPAGHAGTSRLGRTARVPDGKGRTFLDALRPGGAPRRPPAPAVGEDWRSPSCPMVARRTSWCRNAQAEWLRDCNDQLVVLAATRGRTVSGASPGGLTVDARGRRSVLAHAGAPRALRCRAGMCRLLHD
ncbi:hypothetical protein LMG9964_06181 [Paraburkholderia phenoliruptrix]|uniref:Uncharacterized protein n=1 Tax=Paraburkholderia phenoliruptrix TaxID=252970 RepID=A0A6J5KFU6_9BURK|nr:hypothetical protein LMG9964_06181 [Paraburkholderia phenoliruptrix]